MTTRLSAIIMLFVAVIVVSAGIIHYSNKLVEDAKNPEAQVLALSARREDLLATQLRMQQQLESINESIQAALLQQEALNEQVTKLSKRVGATSGTPVVTLSLPTTKPLPALPKLTGAAALSAPVVKTPEPPAPSPVTRAS